MPTALPLGNISDVALRVAPLSEGTTLPTELVPLALSLPCIG